MLSDKQIKIFTDLQQLTSNERKWIYAQNLVFLQSCSSSHDPSKAH